MSSPSKAKVDLPRTIVAGVDAEGRADFAVQSALMLGARFDARVALVHAFPPAPLLWGKESEMPEWSHGTEAAAEAIRARLSAALANASTDLGLPAAIDRTQLSVVAGHPAQVLLRHARELDADLVVLGAHRRRGLFDFGSTARGVIAGAPAAVWVQVEAPRPIRRILVPVDASEDSLAALARARDLAHGLDASLTAVHMFAAPQLGAVNAEMPIPGPNYPIEAMRRASREEFERVTASFDWRDVAHQTRFVEGEPVDEILGMQDGFDLIAMGTHGHTGLSAVLLGSVTYAVLRQACTPVIAFRRAGRRFLT